MRLKLIILERFSALCVRPLPVSPGSEDTKLGTRAAAVACRYHHHPVLMASLLYNNK